jgi:apolipoprotein N-acyltransferase
MGDTMAVSVGSRAVGEGEPVYVIAEIGLNHNGDVDLAMQLIDVAADSGAQAVKFQKRTPEVSTPEHMKSVPRDTPWGTMTYLDYRYRVEFSREQYVEIGDYATVRGLDWFASPWDEPSVDFLEDLNVVAHKVASASVTDLSMLRKLADMVIWPEGASDIDPVAADRAPDEDVAATEFNDVSTKLDAPLVAGTIQQRGSRVFNTSLLWEAGKGAVDHYDKKHPVPFGEYVPDRAFWRSLAPGLIDLIGRDYTPGTTDTVFDVNGVVAGIDICFDITDDGIMRDSIRSGAQILIAQTNNADFGRTDESVQQLAIARIRAMELGRTLVNDSTVGTTAIVLPDGSTVAQLPIYKPGTLVETVPLSTTVTPATVWGQPFELLLELVGLGALIVAMFSARKKRQPLPEDNAAHRQRD